MVIMTKTYGILMSTWSIQRYIAGRKNQTRRLKGLDKINENPEEWKFSGFMWKNHLAYACFQNENEIAKVRCPYGWKGNTLYFKETWAVICNVALPYCECETEEEIKKNHYTEYKADTGNPYPGDWPEDEARGNDEAPKWKSSMFMPLKRARFCDIPITNVRVERLHDITEEDALNEGIENSNDDISLVKDHLVNGSLAVDRYMRLWDTLNSKKIPAFKDPFVWVYEFPFHVK